MPNLFSGVNLALQSLLSQQQMMEVIDHNVANASVPGYRRQTAVMAAGPAYSPMSAPGMMGSGVSVTEIQRYTVEFYNRQYRQEAAESSRWELQRDVVRRVEATLAETSSDGLLTKLDSFWSGWVAVASDPTNLSFRSDLRDRADALADAFNSRVLQLQGLRSDLNVAVVERVQEINASAQEIARLNEEIARVLSTGNQPNDLLDQRDRLLDRLSELSGAVSHLQPNGEVMVSIGGHVLVVGQDSYQLQTSSDPVTQITWADGQAFTPSTGELKGLLAARDSDIPAQIEGLDDLAAAVITEVNALHRAGYNLKTDVDNDPTTDPITGLDFFTGTDALTIGISDAIRDPANIAAALSTGDPGDSSVALAISKINAKPIINGATANQYYSNQVTQLGLDVQRAMTNAKGHKLQVDALFTQRESVSGVNLDEEAANMVKAQRAYQAAARLMTVFDEMLDTVINRMGLVGR